MEAQSLNRHPRSRVSFLQNAIVLHWGLGHKIWRHFVSQMMVHSKHETFLTERFQVKKLLTLENISCAVNVLGHLLCRNFFHI